MPPTTCATPTRRLAARRDDHRASPAVQPQRAVRRRDSRRTAAGAETRDASRRAGRGRDVGQPALLPGHRQRTARARRETACGCAHGAARARTVCGSVRHRRRARQAGGLRELLRRRFLRAAARITLRREAWELPREIFAGDTPVVPLRGRRSAGSWRKPPRRRTNPAPCGLRAVLECASQAGQAVAASPPSGARARKVRLLGRVMANGHPWRHAEQGNRKQADGPAQADQVR